ALPARRELRGCDAADRQRSDIVVVAQVVGLYPGRRAGIVRRAGKGSDDGREERTQVRAADRQIERGGACARVRVDDRELELLLVRAEVDEEGVDLVQHLCPAGVPAGGLFSADSPR